MQCKAYQLQPSQHLNLKQRLKADGQFDPEIVAYCFDNALLWFGNFCEGELSKVDNAPTLEQLLSDPEPISAEDALLILRMRLNQAVGRNPLDGVKR